MNSFNLPTALLLPFHFAVAETKVNSVTDSKSVGYNFSVHKFNLDSHMGLGGTELDRVIDLSYPVSFPSAPASVSPLPLPSVSYWLPLI